MNKNLLLAVLALQIALVAWLNLKDESGSTESLAVMDVPVNQVDRVVVQKGENAIDLVRATNGWLMASNYDLPVAAGRIERVLESLSKQQLAWPISTSSSALERFKVSDDDPDRRVILKQGETVVAEWLLGSSPGFKQLYARKAGDERVFVLTLNDYDFSMAMDSWLDQGLLSAEDIKRIEFNGQVLELKDERWFPQGAEEAFKGNIDTWLDRLDGLRIGKPVELSTQALQKAAEEGWQRFVVTDGSDEKLIYDWLEQDGEYFVRRSDWLNGTGATDESGWLVFSSNQYDYDLLAKGPSASADSQ